ncbi:hypothetical protein [Sphingomonas sp. Mn802worker]|uniref:hypothetical protein n=1 Tax=Sphingomonas sp. Mn802worker TaxID=629773 RepID=UPI0003727366|nr:hypothetical protein [Sphingomonas sp. Mn802worker]
MPATASDPQAIDAGDQPNPFQTIIVGLDQKTNLKSVMQDVLIEMMDPDWDYAIDSKWITTDPFSKPHGKR